MRKKSLFLVIVTLLLGSVFTLAIPPYPGLGLKEPIRPRIPRSNQMSHRKNVSPFNIPAINLAPKGLLVLVNFSDITFDAKNTQLAFDSLANGEDYNYNGATGSCQAYFKAQSNGQYMPEFDVVGPFTLPQTSAYYAANDKIGNDRYVVDFVVDACQAADKSGVDFSQYDNDNNGIVDFIYIIYAGYAESEGGDERPSDI